MAVLLKRWRRCIEPREREREKGQAATEYAIITAALLGGTILSWPYFVELINAMNQYYDSVYWVINAPLP